MPTVPTLIPPSTEHRLRHQAEASYLGPPSAMTAEVTAVWTVMGWDEELGGQTVDVLEASDAGEATEKARELYPGRNADNLSWWQWTSTYLGALADPAAASDLFYRFTDHREA